MVDPAQLAAMQQKTRNIKALIRVDYPAQNLTLSLTTDDPEGAQMVPQILEQFSKQLATQLSSFMAMEGKIVEKHGEEEKPK